MSGVRLEGVVKRWGGGGLSLSLHIPHGRTLCVLGPSGCGKTTVLRLIAGLINPDGGRIEIDGRDVRGVSPSGRGVGMVFQDAALMPHLDVRANIALGPELRGLSGAALDTRVREAASTAGALGLLGRRVDALSGGERHRVALARSLASDPGVWLLDEPLAGLDGPSRGRLRAELGELYRQGRRTVLHVTHDQEEAMALGDEVLVLREGEAQQTAPPGAIYDAPANQFVASFVGWPGMNFVPGQSRPGAFVPDDPGLPPVSLPHATEGRATLGIRPHDLTLAPLNTSPDTPPGAPAWPATIVHERVVGPEVELTAQAAATRLVLRCPRSTHRPLGPDSKVTLTFTPARAHLFGPEGVRIDPQTHRAREHTS